MPFFRSIMDAATKNFNFEASYNNSCEKNCENKINVESIKNSEELNLKSVVFSESFTKVRQAFKKGAFYSEWADDGGFSLLCSAIENNRPDIAAYLIKKNAIINHPDPKSFSKTPLEIAVLKNNISIVQLLLERGADVNPATRPSLIESAYYSFFKWKEMSNLNKHLIQDNFIRSAPDKRIDALCERGLNFQFQQNTNHRIFCLLLDYGANVNADNPDENILISAAFRGDLRNVHTILKHNPNFNLKFRHGEMFFEYLLRYYTRNTRACTSKMHQVVLQYIKFVVRNECFDFKLTETNLVAINSLPKFALFKAQCEEEINRMKTDIIEGTIVSIYNIFVKNTYCLYRYACNDEIIKAINTNNLMDKYPIFEEEIVERFELGLERKRLLADVYSILLNIEFFQLLSSLSLDLIFGFLSNDNLKDFLRA